jgi:PPK2 family polyphosphate:nucleotide phosphotransferase
MKPAAFLKRFRVDDPEGFDLSQLDCADTGGIDKDDAHKMLADDIERLADMQKRLYAQEQWAVLIILQGMDAGGKDGVVAHVMSGVNPQGCDVHSFKVPTAEERAHDFLWRTTLRLPARGRIGIFNRSYYEEVLVVRVHPDALQRQKIPAKLVGKSIWKERFQDIRAFERHLVRDGTVVLKFFLHISQEEQRQRFLDRLDDPAKRWKFSMNDVTERRRWSAYQAAYQDAIKATSRPGAPWYVVPSDHKWFARLVVAAAIIETLGRLDLDFPRIEGGRLKELRKVRKALETEAPRKAR